MIANGMEDDVRRKAARHVRDAYKRVRDMYAESMTTAATPDPAAALKVARDELDEIAGILEDVDSTEHGDMAPRLRLVGEGLAALNLETFSRVLIDIRDAINTLQKHVPA